MAKPKKRKSVIFGSGYAKPPGLSPGTLTVKPGAPKAKVEVLAYGPDGIEEHEVTDFGAIRNLLNRWPVTWINVDGVQDAATIEEIGRIFDFHPLALEDVVTTRQRPKLEQYDDNLFLVLRMPLAVDDIEQVSIFVGRNYVVTMQEGRPGDCFEPVRARIRQGKGKIRRSESDYLAYALIDSIVDHYFPAVESLGEKLEDLEDKVVLQPSPTVLHEVYGVRQDLLSLRRALFPMREVINAFMREDTHYVHNETRIYLRDCYDHTVQLMDLIETCRELSAGLTETHLSSISNRMNEIMKVLSIIATIFIPLSFIASVYGMNFNTNASPLSMPELNWYWGYPMALTLMALTAAAFVYYFYRKGWLRSEPHSVATHGHVREHHTYAHSESNKSREQTGFHE